MNVSYGLSTGFLKSQSQWESATRGERERATEEICGRVRWSEKGSEERCERERDREWRSEGLAASVVGRGEWQFLDLHIGISVKMLKFCDPIILMPDSFSGGTVPCLFFEVYF
ncbi:hypothetical protein NE237_032598 [Protea cynaroides]|uniref:Uncharacterized protein n=1 Tax=Protea cynaroides TaxID=273540 RepID=A0A9Q0L3S9_9MAGN|nr:hypothetical protein NE237_032598 [Protea cynaroides]